MTQSTLARPLPGKPASLATLTRTAINLADRLHSGDVEAVHADLLALQAEQLAQVAMILAGMASRPRVNSKNRNQLRPCGTHAAFARHKRRGDPFCATCDIAERIYHRERKRRAAAQDRHDELVDIGCGTHPGYNRHKYHGEKVDKACADAERTYQRDRKRAQRAAARNAEVVLLEQPAPAEPGRHLKVVA